MRLTSFLLTSLAAVATGLLPPARRGPRPRPTPWPRRCAATTARR
ncbi:MAG: hypothetical protein WKG07_28730 [Hymenobacter sp.]